MIQPPFFGDQIIMIVFWIQERFQTVNYYFLSGIEHLATYTIYSIKYMRNNSITHYQISRSNLLQYQLEAVP